MKYFLTTAFCLMISFCAAVSIYDIQYTTDAGDGTYPSTYAGQNVEVAGVVSAVRAAANGFYIVEADGGVWRGIFVYSSDTDINIGDMVAMSGEITEYRGLTEVYQPINIHVSSSGNPVPFTPISVLDLNTREAYESVPVSISNVTVTGINQEYGEMSVSDGNSTGVIDDYCYDFLGGDDYASGDNLSLIKGVSTYTYGSHKLNPRSHADISAGTQTTRASFQSQEINTVGEFNIPIIIDYPATGAAIETLSMYFYFDPSIVLPSGETLAEIIISQGSMLDNADIQVNPTGGGFNVVASLDTLARANTPAFTLVMQAVASGDAQFQISYCSLDDVAVERIISGQITISLPVSTRGDVLTTIQRPILSIAEIAVPDEEFEIICLAPSTTTAWECELQYANETVAMTINQTYYDTDVNRWILSVTTPQVERYELYNLAVRAQGIDEDIARNAVLIVPQLKDEYYFVHITDTHLPTHFFYTNPAADTDRSEVDDLRAVIDDINLIRPEFVVHTGDLVNEGELEDFEGHRYYSIAKNLLGELEVPLYLIAGNHDIGGWDDTPPVDGTSRRDWWRFFGWSWLDNPPAADNYYTQNYDWEYGGIHYLAMEAYDNYDSFRYSIYGADSFTSRQLNWLDSKVSSTPDKKHVAVYHYDFSEQINMQGYDLDMALWGHVHGNRGNVNTYPYNLATDCTCDDTRAYRVIKVNNDILNPQATVYAGGGGQALEINYAYPNVGASHENTATINNTHPISFEHGLVKFITPAGDIDYTVVGGTIEQIIRGTKTSVYVNVNIAANRQQTVTITSLTATNDVVATPGLVKHSAYPNPFSSSTNIRLSGTSNLRHADVEIFNIKGQSVRRMSHEIMGKVSDINWDGLDKNGQRVSNGLYFYKISCVPKVYSGKMLLIK